MDCERAVNKVLRDLKQFELIKEDDEGQVRIHLTRLAVACLEEGLIESSNYKRKIVIQENSEHVQIGEEYLGIDNAAKELKIDRTVIERSIRFNRITKKGYYWKYKTNGTQTT